MERQPHGWHRENIKAELRKQHGGLGRLSREWGYGRTAITQALKRSDYSIRLERRIAQTLGVTPEVLWPDRWDPDGTPRQRSSTANPSPSADPAHRKSETAA